MADLKLNIRGTEVPVYVNGTGEFWADLNETRYKSDRLEDLRQQLMKAARKAAAKIEVPFVLVTEQGRRSTQPGGLVVRHGVANGMHASRDRVVLVRWDDGGAEQLEQYSIGSTKWTLERLDPPAEIELRQLQTALTQAKAAFDRFMDDHRIDLPAVVTARVAEAMGGES